KDHRRQQPAKLDCLCWPAGFIRTEGKSNAGTGGADAAELWQEVAPQLCKQFATDKSCSVSERMESFRERVPGRRSMPRSAQCPCRSLSVGRCRTCGGRDTTGTPPSAGCGPQYAA